ncbi:START domain-containing protein 10-like [Lethenteron reissneri]|uniref:START domain-containing protein 10-like n=1 Tax=Lethenteron reissneri TaxID=7753 RepID=UPI002AB68D1C|nr:START domain-containing protein 10-like [Lethenteron reissneri]
MAGQLQGVQVPDDSAFISFRAQCDSDSGWLQCYSRSGVTVWCQPPAEGQSVQKLKMRLVCKDVQADTMCDVLHDAAYRHKWDANVIQTHDIGRLTANADVGYYAWKCPKPLKNRDFVTLRSWLPLENDYLIINHSVKHPKFPPKKDFVRAVSILTGYLVRSHGNNGCTLIYLTQLDPKGSLPKWVVNRASQMLAPKAMKRIHKACVKYPAWKRRHEPQHKPWLYPEQSNLPSVRLAELALQRCDSLEHIDESALAEACDDHAELSEDDDNAN